MKPKLVLFDLGRVLADLGSPSMQMQLRISDQEFWSVWLSLPAVYGCVIATHVSLCLGVRRIGGVLVDVTRLDGPANGESGMRHPHRVPAPPGRARVTLA